MKSTVLAPLAGLLIAAVFGWLSRSAARDASIPVLAPAPSAVGAGSPSAAPSVSRVSVPAASPIPAAPAAETSTAAIDGDTEVEAPPAQERARALRLPVVAAIRNTGLADDAKHRAMREALARSGSSTEAWTRDAASTFGAWANALGGVRLALEPASAACYRAGCEALVTFPDRASYERAAAAFREIAEPEATHGGRVQTPPLVLPDGRLQTSWMFLRPDTALPAGEPSEDEP